jgi:hypothetical protein
MSCLRSMRLARRTTASSARFHHEDGNKPLGHSQLSVRRVGMAEVKRDAGSPLIVRIIAPCWQRPAMAGAQLSIKPEARTLGGGLFPIRVISTVGTSYQSGRQCGLFHDPMYPKPAITLSRKDWYSAANRGVLSPLQTDAPSGRGRSKWVTHGSLPVGGWVEK